MITLPAAVLADGDALTAREWIVGNGLGGFACGTVSGIATRRYHGLLVAALSPPRGRNVLVSHLDESIVDRFAETSLASHAFADTTVADGCRHIEGFRIDPLPRWRFRAVDAVLERVVCMHRGHNTTIVQYTLREGRGAVLLHVRPFGAFRDFHHHTHQNPAARIHVAPGPRPGVVELRPYEGGPRVLLRSEGLFVPSPQWWNRFHHALEAQRGLDSEEDLFTPGAFHIPLAPGQTAYLVMTSEDTVPDDPAAIVRNEIARLAALAPPGVSNAEAELHRAVDLYRADLAKPPAVIAGYPWFEDWGRDTLIAFTGLYLVPKRYAEAKALLAAFAKYVDRGMLPNRFPDGGAGRADDNTVDAPMWFVHAARRFVQHTNDLEFASSTLIPAIRDIVDAWRAGAKYGIVQRPDGLVTAGDAGTQLTWMDARAGDTVFTPRHGCPVEINALWHAALRTLDDLLERTGAPAEGWREEADRVRDRFRKAFWNPATAYLDDVARDTGNDPAVRPNALYALALPGDLLGVAEARLVLQRARDELLVPLAVRTLSPRDPAYKGRYAGDPWNRDAAYHQGTAWPFVLGAFTMAAVRTGARAGTLDAARAEVRGLLAGLEPALARYGLGHLPEIVEGDAPHRPVGCFAQAWSDAEALRALVEDADGRGVPDEFAAPVTSAAE